MQMFGEKYVETVPVPWKQRLTERFEQWLDQLESDPEAAAAQPSEHTPDLYAFYEALCLLGGDVRKGTRRSHETFVRFGETLKRFEQMLQTLTERQIQAREQSSRLAQYEQKAFLTPYAQMLERLMRLEEKLADPPATGLLSARRKWGQAWSAFRDGFGLLREHFEQLLRQAGIEKMVCVGRPFDPALMKAVAVVQNNTVAHNTVLEEVAAGFIYKGEVLKFAEVKIAVEKGAQ